LGLLIKVMKPNKLIKGQSRKSLPEDGWIQSCLICNAPTARTFKYFYTHQIYSCYFCKACLRCANEIHLYTRDILLNVYE
jgi:hypothetical protein